MCFYELIKLLRVKKVKKNKNTFVRLRMYMFLLKVNYMYGGITRSTGILFLILYNFKETLNLVLLIFVISLLKTIWGGGAFQNIQNPYPWEGYFNFALHFLNFIQFFTYPRKRGGGDNSLIL